MNTAWRRMAGVSLLAAFLVTGCTEPDLQDLKSFVTATRAASPGKGPEPLPKVEEYSPFLYTAQGLRDPFTVSSFVQQATEELEQVADTGIRPDPNRPREELEKYALGSLEMVGTFRGLNDDTLWALIKAPDGIIYRVRKGNYLGRDYGRIDQITEDRIELTEIVPEGGKGGWKERQNFLSLSE